MRASTEGASFSSRLYSCCASGWDGGVHADVCIDLWGQAAMQSRPPRVNPRSKFAGARPRATHVVGTVCPPTCPCSQAHHQQQRGDDAHESSKRCHSHLWCAGRPPIGGERAWRPRIRCSIQGSLFCTHPSFLPPAGRPQERACIYVGVSHGTASAICMHKADVALRIRFGGSLPVTHRCKAIAQGPAGRNWVFRVKHDSSAAEAVGACAAPCRVAVCSAPQCLHRTRTRRSPSN